jgi:hypothetical protein
MASQEVLSKLKKASKEYGVPTWIVSSIVEHESGFNPKAHGDIGLGASGSWGLFQLYTGNGHGKGFSPDRLTNIDTNISLAMPHLKRGYEGAKAKGLTGFALLEETASRSGWPLMTGNMPSSYKSGLQKTFKNGDELSGMQSSNAGLTYQVADIGTWIVGDTQNVSKELLGRLAFMGKTYNEKVSITSGFRSKAKQQILYDLYLAGKGNLAAKPGSSNHEKGLAVDIANPKLQAKSDDIFKSFGLHRPVFSPQRELWHIELYNGTSGTGTFNSGEVREKLKNGFDSLGVKELSQGSYSVFLSLDEMGRTQSTLNSKLSEGFGIPEFINGSGKSIAYRSLVVIIGLILIIVGLLKTTNIGEVLR